MAAEARSGWRAKLRHAFGLDAPGPFEPDPQVRALVDDLLRRVVRRRMTVPAAMALESWRPMGMVSGQFMHALTPFTGVVLDAKAWTALAAFVERREAIPWMIDRLHELDHAEQGSDPSGA